MAVVITHVDDLHKAEDDRNVPATETIRFAVDGVEYSTDLTHEHATEFRSFAQRYIDAVTKVGSDHPVRKKGASHHLAAAGDTPLKASRRHHRRIRAFADSRADLGEASYMTPGGGFYYIDRLRTAYAEYEAAHGPFPLPDDPS